MGVICFPMALSSLNKHADKAYSTLFQPEVSEEVLPQEELSLQRHSHRSEYWYIISDEGLVTKNDDQIRVLAGDSVDLPVKDIHRVKNTGSQNLIFIEIAQGDYLGEDDIESFDDKYGRA